MAEYLESRGLWKWIVEALLGSTVYQAIEHSL